MYSTSDQESSSSTCPSPSNGLVATGTNADGSLVEIIELEDHPWFVAVQFHPEFKSKPTAAQPLFAGFIEAALSKSRLV